MKNQLENKMEKTLEKKMETPSWVYRGIVCRNRNNQNRVFSEGGGYYAIMTTRFVRRK